MSNLASTSPWVHVIVNEWSFITEYPVYQSNNALSDCSSLLHIIQNSLVISPKMFLIPSTVMMYVDGLYVLSLQFQIQSVSP